MLDIYKAYATDEKLEINGFWKDLGGGARVKIARTDNQLFITTRNKLLDEHKDQLTALRDQGTEQATQEADDISKRILARAMAVGILRDFEGLGFKNEPLAYSVEAAEKLLAIKDFADMIWREAVDVTNFRVKEDEVVQKNS